MLDNRYSLQERWTIKLLVGKRLLFLEVVIISMHLRTHVMLAIGRISIDHRTISTYNSWNSTGSSTSALYYRKQRFAVSISEIRLYHPECFSPYRPSGFCQQLSVTGCFQHSGNNDRRRHAVLHPFISARTNTYRKLCCITFDTVI